MALSSPPVEYLHKPVNLLRGALLLLFLTSSFHAMSTNVDEYHQLTKQLLKEAKIPGISIATIKNGELAWTISEGKLNSLISTPVTKRTVFEAASLSKPVLAYITLKMIARGELSLGEKLYKHLPHDRIEHTEYARQLTPLLVLSHQTGLPNWGGTPLNFNNAPGDGFWLFR